MNSFWTQWMSVARTNTIKMFGYTQYLTAGLIHFWFELLMQFNNKENIEWSHDLFLNYVRIRSHAVLSLYPEKFFQMKRSQCKDGLEIYKRFLTRMTRVSEFFKIAEVAYTAQYISEYQLHIVLRIYYFTKCHCILLQQVGIDKNDIPELTQVRSFLTPLFFWLRTNRECGYSVFNLLSNTSCECLGHHLFFMQGSLWFSFGCNQTFTDSYTLHLVWRGGISHCSPLSPPTFMQPISCLCLVLWLWEMQNDPAESVRSAKCWLWGANSLGKVNNKPLFACTELKQRTNELHSKYTTTKQMQCVMWLSELIG